MVFNHKAYEELFPRKEKQPKQKATVKMGNVLEEAEQAPNDLDPDDVDPDEGGEDDGNE